MNVKLLTDHHLEFLSVAGSFNVDSAQIVLRS